jgi:hypothetical protein
MGHSENDRARPSKMISLAKALAQASDSGKPPPINCVIDPHARTESGDDVNLSTMQTGL